MQRLADELLADLPLLDDDPAPLDDVTRQLEHRLAIRIRRVDGDVGIGARAEVSLVPQSEDPAGPARVMIAISDREYSRSRSLSRD